MPRTARILARMHPHFSLSDAFDHALRMVERIAALFGDPVAIRDQGEMRRSDARALIAWLAPLEDFVRRLFIIAACRALGRRRLSAVSAAPPPPAAHRPRRVGFRILPSPDRPYTPHRPLRPPRRMSCAEAIASAPLARRFNALVTALASPQRIIARLARRLASAAARIRALLAAPAPTRDAIADAAQGAATAAVEAALAQPFNSS
ncbi:MAG: hypothetical protein GC206_08420 [Alphaproteobacteria bacterium]|nr:hypothetical protein [Alphaproteobacteria bacterium]